MRKRVRAVIMSGEEHLSDASPLKVRKTGNVVIDRQNDKFEAEET